VALDRREVPPPGGRRPFSIPDSTKVLGVVPDRQLVLAARARPLVSAVVTFTLVSDGTHCVVTFQEEPAQKIIGNIVRPLLDPITHMRNHVSLKRLDAFLRARKGADEPAVDLRDSRSTSGEPPLRV